MGLALVTIATDLSAATLKVGPGQRFRRIADAIAASHDGDVIAVSAGLYVNDFAEITTRITLQSVGGMARIMSRGYIPNRKGILLTDTDVTITGFELSGARVTDNDGANGAGIRYQGGNLVLKGCYIHDNQEGLLGNADPGGSITIVNSEFYRNGNATGPVAGYTHNVYAGAVAKLDIENSFIHEAKVGHEVKSRAFETIVNNSRIIDGASGSASYSIDLPNGGVGVITGDMIEQGPRSQNPIIIAYGEEGGVYSTSGLVLQNNMILNDLPNSYSLGLWNTTGAPATMTTTSVFGLSARQLALGPVTFAGTVTLSTEPALPTKHPWQ